MDLDVLQKFLAKHGHERFIDYAVQYGKTPAEGLENRVAWAWRMRRSATHADEARFLIDHEGPLRALCHETAGGMQDDNHQWEGWEDDESTHAASADEILAMQVEAQRRQTPPSNKTDDAWDDWEDDDQDATVVVTAEAIFAQTTAQASKGNTGNDGWDEWEDEQEATMVAQPEDIIAMRKQAARRASTPKWQPATKCFSCGASLEGVTAFWHTDNHWRCRDCFRAGR